MKKQAILIMVDTQRQDMLSCYDEDSIHTKAIDSIAENATLFRNAYTCSPVCGPARSAIFTGLHPSCNGMYSNGLNLGQNIKTIGEYLTDNEIKSGYIGKWHLDGGDYFGNGVCPKGYLKDYWYDMRNYLEEFSDEERKKSRRNMSLRIDDPEIENTYAHRCANRAIDFIEKYKNDDFFLTLSLDEPHDPSVCPRDFFKQVKGQKFKFHRTKNVKASLKNKPEHQRIWSKKFKSLPFFAIKIAMRGLFACNLFCDYEIGRVLEKIKASGIQPMIIYTSDHGDMLLSHSLMGKGCVMYNEITKIPLLISGGGFEKGVCDTPVSHIDLAPTILEHFGISKAKILQGEPIKQAMLKPERDAFIEYTRYEIDQDGFMGYQPIRCIVNKDFKLVINLLTSDELYDLKNDPYELNNLIDDEKFSEIRDKLHDRLIDKMNEIRDSHRGYYWLCRPWRKGVKPSASFTGYARATYIEGITPLDYATGLAVSSRVRKK